MEIVSNSSAKSFNTLKLFKSISNTIEDTQCQVLAQFSDSFVSDSAIENDDEKILSRPFIGRNKTKVLPSDVLDQVVTDISLFSEYLKLTPIQTIVLVAYMTGEMLESIMDDGIGVVKKFLNLDALDCISLKPEIKYLLTHGYLIVRYSRRSQTVTVDKVLFNAIASNSDFALSDQAPVDRYSFCQKVATLVQDDDASAFLQEEVNLLEKEFASLSFVKEVNALLKKKHADSTAATLFYCVCDAYANGYKLPLNVIVAALYGRISDRMRNINQIHEGSHPLVELDLVEVSKGMFTSEVNLTLTENGKRLFLEGDYLAKNQNKDVIEVSDIKAKTLFYDNKTSCQINFLRESLDDDKFVSLQKRLEDKSLPKGVAVLLYGAPGTGKTETVLQIARETGRRVMHVDISQSRSCWFGESEKIIKRIFANYRDLCKADTRKPILLFNEADAIFSKRRDSDSSNISQTINTIQNIILEELETLDGILMATTNLANNIDEAFDRRFLFKVQFERPSIDTKKAIWNSKLPMLSVDECKKLAERYDLSGGEIDNVVRKATMNEIIHGGQTSFDYIDGLCKEEKLDARKGTCSKVGF